MTDATHLAFPADGYDAAWTTWDGDDRHELAVRWENEGWTATGVAGREDVQYVIRLSPWWQVRQFMLFRDLAEPDLWLGTDGQGRWGEMNGAHRTDLDGAHDVALATSPFTHTLPIRRLPLGTGDSAEVVVIEIDVETLGAVTRSVTYERIADRRWRVSRDEAVVEFMVDAHGVPHDIDGQFRRSSAAN